MTTLVVYWIDREGVSHYEEIPPSPDQITKLLACCAARRAEGMRFITHAGDTDMGGIVRDGKLPNGHKQTKSLEEYLIDQISLHR